MKIALFASGKVGLEIAKHFRAQGFSLGLLVTSSQDVCHGKLIEAELIDTNHLQWSGKVEPSQVEEVKSLGLDLIIAAWWPYILREEVFAAPRHGTLNFHPSLLPHGRGKHPNFWSIVEGTPFGVTIHFIDSKIDNGDIAFQRKIPVSWVDTGESLHHKACEEIVELFKENFERIVSGDIPRIRQSAGKSRLHLGREIDSASRIDLSQIYQGRELLNLLRARTYPPYPGCWFADGDAEYQIRIDITPRDKPI